VLLGPLKFSNGSATRRCWPLRDGGKQGAKADAVKVCECGRVGGEMRRQASKQRESRRGEVLTVCANANLTTLPWIFDGAGVTKLLGGRGY
jgi:hypothetical protein